MTGRNSLVCFGDLYWNNGYERNHSIIRGLIDSGIYCRCVYVEPSYWVSEFFEKKDHLKRFLRGDKEPLKGKIYLENILHCFPFAERVYGLRWIENWFYKQKIISRVRPHDFSLFVNRISFDLEDLIVELIKKANFTFFDFSDDFVEFSNDSRERQKILSYLENIVPKVDAVLYVNEHVKARYGHLNKNNLIVRNATNYSNFDRENFSRVDSLEEIKAQYEKIVGYIGTANLIRFDLAAVEKMLEDRKQWALVFVGNIEERLKQSLEKYPNVFFVPFVPYHALPDHMNYFDACIAPMQVNEHTKGNDLLKLHDYLAMGKPVVASDVGGAADLSSVSIYRSPDEFLGNLDVVMSSDSDVLVKDRKLQAFHNSWQFRLKEFRELLIKQFGSS